jgi:hypothetical protein
MSSYGAIAASFLRGDLGMRNVCAVALLLAVSVSAPVTKAQTVPAVPAVKLYGGYDYTRFNINAKVSGQPPSATYNGNGGNGQLAYNVDDWFGVWEA